MSFFNLMNFIDSEVTRKLCDDGLGRWNIKFSVDYEFNQMKFDDDDNDHDGYLIFYIKECNKDYRILVSKECNKDHRILVSKIKRKFYDAKVKQKKTYSNSFYKEAKKVLKKYYKCDKKTTTENHHD